MTEWSGERWRVIHGDSLDVLRSLEPGVVDLVLTDPPYSSGGMTRADRAGRSTGEKYQSSTSGSVLPDFDGDNRDQRSWIMWSAIWMQVARVACAPGASLFAFTDWRQLPALTDAMQGGGWVWKQMATWEKPPCESRPNRGTFWSSAEYILHGVNGRTVLRDDSPCLPGVLRHAAPRIGARLHIAQKPVGLLSELCAVAPPGGMVLDPFGGSGSTGEAALRSGRRVIVIEAVAEWAALCADRLRAVEDCNDVVSARAGQAGLFGGGS